MFFDIKLAGVVFTRFKASYYLQLLRLTHARGTTPLQQRREITERSPAIFVFPSHLPCLCSLKVPTSRWLWSSPSAPLMRVRCVQDSPSDPWMVMAIPAAPTAHAITAGTPARRATAAGRRGGKRLEYLGVIVTRMSRQPSVCVCVCARCISVCVSYHGEDYRGTGTISYFL